MTQETLAKEIQILTTMDHRLTVACGLRCLDLVMPIADPLDHTIGTRRAAVRSWLEMPSDIREFVVSYLDSSGSFTESYQENGVLGAKSVSNLVNCLVWGAVVQKHLQNIAFYAPSALRRMNPYMFRDNKSAVGAIKGLIYQTDWPLTVPTAKDLEALPEEQQALAVWWDRAVDLTAKNTIQAYELRIAYDNALKAGLPWGNPVARAIAERFALIMQGERIQLIELARGR